jgi:hypothetical protein
MLLKWLFRALVTLAMALGVRPVRQERKLSRN